MYPTVQKDPRGGHNRSSINQKFFQTWSPSMAYILGFIFADGAIEDVQKSSRTCYLSIGISVKDLLLLEEIKTKMKSNHTIYRRKEQLLTFPGGKQYLSREKVTLKIGSKLLYNDLLKLGVTPKKSKTILFPNIPNQYLNYFLRGYFDGDGCIYLIKNKYPRIIFTSGSNRFLEGLSKSLSTTLQIPIKSVYSQMQKSNNLCYRLHYNTKLSRKILEFMYKDLEKAPFLDRKYAIYQKYLNIN